MNNHLTTKGPKMKFSTIAITLSIALSTPALAQSPSCTTLPVDGEHFPSYSPGTTTYSSEVMTAAFEYNTHNYDWRVYRLPAPYRFDGQYVTISPFDVVDGVTTRFDDLGVPQVYVAGGWHYNPTTLSNYALWHHTRLVRDGTPLP